MDMPFEKDGGRSNGPHLPIARNCAAGAVQPYADNGRSSIPLMPLDRDQVLFEHSYRGDVWRLEIVTHNGRTFVNWRRWYAKDGERRPTREGCTIPLEALPALHGALGAYLTGNGPDGPPSES